MGFQINNIHLSKKQTPVVVVVVGVLFYYWDPNNTIYTYLKYCLNPPSAHLPLYKEHTHSLSQLHSSYSVQKAVTRVSGAPGGGHLNFQLEDHAIIIGPDISVATAGTRSNQDTIFQNAGSAQLQRNPVVSASVWARCHRCFRALSIIFT